MFASLSVSLSVLASGPPKREAALVQKQEKWGSLSLHRGQASVNRVVVEVVSSAELSTDSISKYKDPRGSRLSLTRCFMADALPNAPLRTKLINRKCMRAFLNGDKGWWEGRLFFFFNVCVCVSCGLLLWALFSNTHISLFCLSFQYHSVPSLSLFFFFLYCHILSIATVCQPLLAFLVFIFHFYSE